MNMTESSAMLEIRKIRDENSLRHMNMTNEELDKEFAESVQIFMKAIGREVKPVSQQETS